jgi:hypothetical protein
MAGKQFLRVDHQLFFGQKGRQSSGPLQHDGLAFSLPVDARVDGGALRGSLGPEAILGVAFQCGDGGADGLMVG